MSFSQDVTDLCQRMKRRQLEGSLPCAKAAAELLRTLVTSRHYSDAQSLLDIVRSTAVKLERAKPLGGDKAPSQASSGLGGRQRLPNVRMKVVSLVEFTSVLVDTL